MDLRFIGLDSPLFQNFHQHLQDAVEHSDKARDLASKSYVRDAKAMAATPADVKEYPNAYVFVVDMPGLKSGDIKVQVEEDNVLVVSGERKREEENEGAKYVRMELGGQVHEKVSAAGKFQHRRHHRRLSGWGPHRHRTEDSTAGAQEAQDH